jgi:hypothetical protein
MIFFDENGRCSAYALRRAAKKKQNLLQVAQHEQNRQRARNTKRNSQRTSLPEAERKRTEEHKRHERALEGAIAQLGSRRSHRGARTGPRAELGRMEDKRCLPKLIRTKFPLLDRRLPCLLVPH